MEVFERPVLVTGAAGFIGAAVSAALIDLGAEVDGVDHLRPHYDRRMQTLRLAGLGSRRAFRFLQADVAEAEGLSPLEGRPYGAIVHLAGRPGVRESIERPSEYVNANVNGTTRVLEFARRARIPKVVIASTSSVYGNQPGPFREDAPADRPVSPYAATKRAAEMVAYAFHELHGLDVTVFRYFTVYGPAGRPDMAPLRFLHAVAEGRAVRVFGDGTQRRDFTYVDDIVRGTIAGLRPMGFETINLGGDRPVSVMDFLGLVEKVTGRPARVTHEAAALGDVQATWADIGRARRLLEWEPRVRLEEGLARTAEWYSAHRDVVSGCIAP